MKQKHWEMLGFWGVALLFFIATLIFIRWTVEFVTWSALDSGWAQAVGSVIAIGAGFAVANRQARHAAELAHRERIEADDDRLTAAFSIAAHAADLFDEAFYEACDKRSIRGYIEVSAGHLDFQGAIDALASVPLYELRSRRMISGLLALRRCIERLYRMTKAAYPDPEFRAHDYYEWREDLIDLNAARQAAMREIVDELDQSRARFFEISRPV